ncbi:type II toxin-antitoxin system PemK/MazF family toxin [Leuconostoc suionicum]|jgi:Growth inhibitor|uniref:type II toxin-antitoxin system PemK/MazF family toxin n=1 Tax=Leuconostoc TaxID=1243 RepID=UPI001E2A0C23|nr:MULTISPECIES: type II toxin-antitoxin system PemK/MazF family toxin [Leuconostoc]MCC8440732.1 hypothetical protein [Leuconostoc pseudomesenteroides]MDI6498598.1 type II toxin-antitoxin system PemK/MazF family toxin [Leuconostoc suionicum]MDI6500640.1 type II toxin-antitoxin system PemK/MazF family toxin [Leuconostoc suionicum]MDI6502764.1 type II toxin-antitoxin system PemK/MazF family toxin [Leuconostoc suionicum]MDI6523611.1 type II toxin-antitoxin system PemK/MazF family toxin [Leuconost
MTKFKQGDFVVINFDPSVGQEIQKRRPGLVVSSDKYNMVSNLIIVAPITSSVKNIPTRFNVVGYEKVHGQVNTLQPIPMDSVKREAKLIGHMSDYDLYQVLQLIGANFDLTL